MTCPDCEYHKNRAAIWRAEAYKHALGHDVIERPWVGLTGEEKASCAAPTYAETVDRVEAKLKEKNT